MINLALTSAYPKRKDDPTAPFIGSITEHVAALGVTTHVVLPEHAEWARPRVEGRIHFHPYRYSPIRSWTPWGYAQSLEGGVKLRRQLYAVAPVVYASARRTCRRVTSTVDVDLVHAHWLVPNGVIGGSVARRRDLPLVISLHGSDVSIVERKPWLAPLARRAFGCAAVVTAPSNDLLDRASRLGARGDLKLMPYGAEYGEFAPDPEGARHLRQRYGFDADDVVVLAVGRFVRWKGFDDLIASIGRARTQNPALKLLLVGDGDSRSELERQAADLDAQAVTFAGVVTRDEINAYFQASDLVAVPSVHADGFVDGQPNVALEAMAAGKPLVVTNVGGLPALVDGGQNGFIVDERDPRALADALLSLAAAPDRRIAMGVAGQTRIRDELNWNEYAKRLLEIYTAAVGGSR